MKRTRTVISVFSVAVLGIGIIAAADIFSSVSANLRIYRDVIQYLLSEYVDEIDTEELISSSIRGMLSDLDPYTVYIREEEQQSMEMLTRGNYHGVGIQLGIRDNKLTVIAPIEGSPAYRAGVRPGDIIIKIDQESTDNISSEDAGMRIRGKAGTEVTLTFERYGEENPLDITLVREVIDINDLPYFGVQNGIGYIRVSRFSNNTAEEFRDAVVELQEVFRRAGQVDFIRRVARTVIVRVHTAEQLHGGHTGFDKAALITGAEIIRHSLDRDAADITGTAENVHPFARRAATEHRQRPLAQAADGVEVDHAEDLVQGEEGIPVRRYGDVVLRALTPRLLGGEGDKYQGAGRRLAGGQALRQL